MPRASSKAFEYDGRICLNVSASIVATGFNSYFPLAASNAGVEKSGSMGVHNGARGFWPVLAQVGWRIPTDAPFFNHGIIRP